MKKAPSAKQSRETSLPPLNNLASVAVEVTEKERVGILTSTKRDAPLKKRQKCDMLAKFVLLRQDILAAAVSFDAVNHSALKESLILSMPPTKSSYKDASNEELAKKIVTLYDPLLVLRQHLNDQLEAQQSFKSRLRSRLHTSSSSSSVASSAVEKNPVIDTLDDFFGEMETVDRLVREKREAAKNNDNPIKGPSLTNEQRARKFSTERVPIVEENRICVKCGHASINTLEDNAAIILHNQRVEKKFNQDMQAWNAHQKAVVEGRPSSLPAGMSPRQKPRKMQIKKPAFQCMCSTSFCMMENSDVSSSCPIKCIECKDTKKRYSFTNTYPRHCTCPICVCTCSAVYYEDQIPKLSMMYRKMPDALVAIDRDEKKSKDSVEASCIDLLQKCLAEGKDASCKATVAAATNWNDDLSTEMEEKFFENSQSAMYSHAAEKMSKSAAEMSQEQLQYLRNVVGTPTTFVTLPNGQQFDTKTITSSGAHARNNRMTDATSSKQVQPGMVSNLEFDLTSPTNDYLRAAATYKMASIHAPTSIKSPITIDDDDDNTESQPYAKKLKATMNNSHQFLLPTQSSSHAPTRQIMTAATPNPTETAASQMFERVVVRSKRDVSQAFEARKEEDSPEKKKMLEECKDFVKVLMKAKNDGTHIDDVLYVTQNGDQLVEDMAPGMSQEVQKNLKLWY